MSDTVVLYPRGFLGFDIGLAARDPNTNLDQILAAIRFNRPVPKQAVIASNHDVDELWREFTTARKYVTQANFREKILLAGLRAFGTDNFEEWCAIQERSPFFTDMHRRFLNDTFNFILTGNRSMNVMSWQTLLEYEEATHKDREIRLDYKTLFGANLGGYMPTTPFIDIVTGPAWPRPGANGYNPIHPRTELSSVLHFWVAKDNGFEDLIASLFILFGSAQQNAR